MSIAITAQQNFDFQDLVCVEMMLRFAHVTDALFFAEPENGEDGELHFPPNVSGRFMEVQVKGSSGPVTLETVVTCLAHTPPRTEENTLLERLLSGPDRLVVLVMSGRCNDACAPYTVSTDWDGTPHPVGWVSSAQVTDLLDAFAVASIPGTTATSRLRARRRAHNAAFAEAADKSAVRAALSRLIIIECMDAAELESRCANRLRRDYRIPSDRIGAVLGQLYADVKAAKANRTDAFTLIRGTLASAAPPQVRPHDYVERGVESALVEELSNSSVLLLSGMPRVGKTFAARRIAAEFEPHGYEVQESNNVDQVDRFLLEPTQALRLAILDDPLGGTYPVPDPGRALSLIEALILRLPQHRKLIVVQGKSLLLSTAQAEALSACSIAGHSWYDLGILDTTFLTELWQSLVGRFEVPDTLRNFVSEALLDESLKLEPGCLQYLAVHKQRMSARLNLESVVRLAREDASSLGRALAEKGYGYLLSTLTLTTTAREPINLRELAFAMGVGDNALSSESMYQSIERIIDGPLHLTPPVPYYDDTPRLTSAQLDALDQLERSQLVRIGADESVGFVHPFYRAAAEALINGLTHRDAAMTATTMQRGLFCLSPFTSRATARNLDWVFDKLASRADAQSALVDHAVGGLKSCFPATRDLCFRFLVRRFADMPADRQSELPQWIAAVTIQLDNLEWSNGQAYIAFDRRLSMESLWDTVRRVERSEVDTDLRLLNATESVYVSPERAAKVLSFFAWDPTALSLPAIGRLLSYDEAVLRAEAIEVWLSISRDDDEVVLLRIFDDDHPSCALAALKGAVAGWHDYSISRQTQVLDGLSSLAQTAACAAAMLGHLVMFNRVEAVGEKPPWPVFETLLPLAMQALPYNAAFIDARLFVVVRDAVEVLPSASIVAICDGWIGWLERNMAEGYLPPSAFSLGVGEVLLSATRREPEIRARRISRILAFNWTGALITFIADLINDWDALTDEERGTLLARLQAGQSDDRWLQAVALTRPAVPTAVQETLLGDRVSLGDDLDALLAKINPILLNAAVHVYTGLPQPLWWLGTHHSGEATWEPVVERIAQTPSHPLFELAWDDITFGGNGARVSNVMKQIGAENADRILDILIRVKVGCTGNYMPEAWATLLAMASNDETRTVWIDKMASYAPAILDELSDLRLWLSEERDFREMLNRLRSDITLLHMARSIVRSSDDTDANNIRSLGIRALELVLEGEPPQLFGTCDALSSTLERKGVVTPTLKESLQQRREIILEDRERMKDALARSESPLPGWIGP